MKRTLHDAASLAARIGVGAIFFANGWEKLEAGLNATGTQFAELSAPLPSVWAAATMLIELGGGALLVAGLAVSFVGLLLFAEAVAVFVITTGHSGMPLTGGDVKIIVALGAASVLLSVGGAGRVSLDHMVVIKRREAEAADEFAADKEADAVIAALRDPTEGPRAIPPAPAPGEAVAPRGSPRREERARPPRRPRRRIRCLTRRLTRRRRPRGTPDRAPRPRRGRAARSAHGTRPPRAGASRAPVPSRAQVPNRAPGPSPATTWSPGGAPGHPDPGGPTTRCR
ncbi:DoxX family protein [Microtetraspora malaysiensis]|uniref:DoxX family protein n=1 Tax=Microtetraspora malaysiensis TaxID=161358 RepID=UPI003D93C263